MWAKKIQIEAIVIGAGDREKEMDWSEDIVYEKNHQNVILFDVVFNIKF